MTQFNRPRLEDLLPKEFYDEIQMYHAVMHDPRHAEENMLHVYSAMQQDICKRYNLNASQFTKEYCKYVNTLATQTKPL